MSKCSIIGAGIAGCVVARMLAECGMAVNIYEQSGSTGGVLRTLPQATISPLDRDVCAWFCTHTPLYPGIDGALCPKRGYTWLCEQLIAHKGISLLLHCHVVDVVSATAGVSAVISTASPDQVTHSRFGVLPWEKGMPVHNETTWQQFQAYQLLFKQAGIFSCGSLASYDVLSIPHIVRQAKAVTDAITCPTPIVAAAPQTSSQSPVVPDVSIPGRRL